VSAEILSFPRRGRLPSDWFGMVWLILDYQDLLATEELAFVRDIGRQLALNLGGQPDEQQARRLRAIWARMPRQGGAA
jgi:hypothetical protein